MNEILQLPFQVQATLVAGYLGYALLKRDHRKNEKALDVWMHILLLGLPTVIVTQIWDTPWAYASVLISPILAFVWVKWCKKLWYELLHRFDVSYDTGDGDVWNALSTRKGVAMTQITVTHKNGKRYYCDDVPLFYDSPFSPCVMGDDGIGFYVTHVKVNDDREWEEVADVKEAIDWGDEVTYFPRADIVLLEVRYTTQISGNQQAEQKE